MILGVESMTTELSNYVREWLRRQGWSMYEAETHTGIPRATWQRITSDPSWSQKLKLETIFDLAEALQIPRWRMMQLCGYDIDLTDDLDVKDRLVAELNQKPWLIPVIDFLLDSQPDDQRMFLAYLRSLRNRGV